MQVKLQNVAKSNENSRQQRGRFYFMGPMYDGHFSLCYEDPNGSATYKLPPPVQYGETIVIGPGYISANPKGKGYGTRLLSKLTSHLQLAADVMKKIIIHRPSVHVGNYASQGLFKKFNYAIEKFVKDGEVISLFVFRKFVPKERGSMKLTSLAQQIIAWISKEISLTTNYDFTDGHPIGI